MSIDFNKIEGEVTYDADGTGITIKLREIIVAPAPPPPPPTPVGWSYPEIESHFTCGPADIDTLIRLLRNDAWMGSANARATVKLLDGIYNFPATVYPKVKNMNFIAAHGANVVFNFNTKTGHGLYFTASGASTDISFRRIRFTDLRAGDTGQGGFQLIKFDTGARIGFYECETDNSRASGIYSNSGASDLYFFGHIIRDNGYSSQFDHGAYMHSAKGELTFERSFFVNNASHGLHCYDGSSSNTELIQHILVADCTFLSYGEPQDRPIIFQDATSAVTKVVSNEVFGCMFFNAHPTKDSTEADRNSVKFVNPSECEFDENVLWNVPLVAPAAFVNTWTNNIVLPSSTMLPLYTRFDVLDPVAHRYALTLFNTAMLPTVNYESDELPTGRYEVHSVAAPIGTAAHFINHVQGEPIFFDMTRKYSRPQHRAGGFDFGTHVGANAFRLIRMPD